MIFIIFFLFLFYAQVYFSALIKSHIFDSNIEQLSLQQLQTKSYIEGICLYVAEIIVNTKEFSADSITESIDFSELYFDEYDRIQVSLSITEEFSNQYLFSITCIRKNNTLWYYIRIKREDQSFSIISYQESKKELFQ